MSELEWLAAILGVVNVTLIVRRSVANYPFGAAMVVFYFFVFKDAKLYSDALLQAFFLVIQVYGWWNWIAARTGTGDVPVGVLGGRERACWAAGTVLVSLTWGFGMAQFTDAAAPFADAFVAGGSVTAQVLMARRRVESWVLWILVDIVAIALFASRGLALTAGLYLLFLGLAAAGLIAWRRASRAAVA